MDLIFPPDFSAHRKSPHLLQEIVNRSVSPANLCFPFSHVLDARKRESFILARKENYKDSEICSFPLSLGKKKGNDLGTRSIAAFVLAPKGNEVQSCQSSGEKFDANMRDKGTKEEDKKYEKSGKNNRRENSLSVRVASFIRIWKGAIWNRKIVGIAWLGAVKKIKTALWKASEQLWGR